MHSISKLLFCLLLTSFGFSNLKAGDNPRTREDFDANWRFHLGDVSSAKEPSFNDKSWRQLNLPHDWSIEGKFSLANPATPGGGALPGGIGWYRKTFTLPQADEGKLLFINFDGVYMNSEVWINGHYLGKRPYGYSSFRYELTPYLHYGDEPNVIAVRVDNSEQPNSRWYSGSGIYRNVWLVKTNKVYVHHWGTYITTPEVSDASAKVAIQTQVKNASGHNDHITLKTIIYDAAGNQVATASSENEIPDDSIITFGDQLDVSNPHLWSLDDPYRYHAVSQVMRNGQIEDEYTTPLGIRTFQFTVDKGFFLNGKHVKIRGVCDHHDLGCLGAAVNKRAIERQLSMLKEMGCNAIRTSHNPPAPELLELCDSLGMIVMDEAFDCWKKGKKKYDYHLYWDQWHKRDLTDLIMRDRNHPSIMIWSIGNEIPEQGDTSALRIAPELASIVKSLDTTRPITSALNHPSPDNYIYRSGALDLVGNNYHHEEYPDFPKRFPGQKFIATETVSALETRGHYDMPSDSIRPWPIRGGREGQMNADYTCSAYDNCRVPWGSTHEATLKVMEKYDFLSGQFIWTGWDYLGEPTPYWWPARSSYFGIIDLAGFPKDAYYLYKSVWTDKPVLHIFPYWNWTPGDSVDVWAYYNDADEVELYLNGKSLGVRKKTGDELHVMWRVAYEPGTLKAVSRKDGEVVLTREIHTAGKPAKLVLSADRDTIDADGKDLSFVTVRVEDADGNLIPHADNFIQFHLQGKGFIAGVDNGSETDHEPFKASFHHAFNGLCLAVVQSDGQGGNITLKADSPGLQSASLNIEAK